MKFDPVPIFILILSAAIVLVFVFFGNHKSNSDIGKPNTAFVAGTPELQISNKDFYLAPGVIIRQKDITITNNGNGSLTLSGFATSSKVRARLIQSEQLSPDFQANNHNDWQTNLDAGDDIILSITFDDNFDWVNPIAQFVKFKTNDPQNQDVTINFSTSPLPGDPAINSSNNEDQTSSDLMD